MRTAVITILALGALGIGASELEAQEPAIPPPLITARQLVAAYEANEIDANSMFRDKTVRVQGTIDEIRSDLFGGAYIALEAQTRFGIHCFFDSESAVSGLVSGEEAIVQGRVLGSILGAVQLDHCQISSEGGSE